MFWESGDGFSTLSPAVKMSQQVLGAGRNEALAQQHFIIITILSQQQCYHNSPKGSLEVCTLYNTCVPDLSRARIYKRLRSPWIDSLGSDSFLEFLFGSQFLEFRAITN